MVDKILWKCLIHGIFIVAKGMLSTVSRLKVIPKNMISSICSAKRNINIKEIENMTTFDGTFLLK
jgi:hypothetical protein